jgi:NAD(P)-dependent dehydrogenase (short-subunit alcohol dehydrogenase family)
MRNLYNLDRRVHIITGGTKGIGQAIVRQIAAHEGRLAFCSRSPGEAARLADDLNALAKTTGLFE